MKSVCIFGVVLLSAFSSLALATEPYVNLSIDKEFQTLYSDSDGDFQSQDVINSSQVLPERLTSDLTINGDVTLQHTVYLDGHHLTITGNLLHSAGVLVINGGRLTVQGDYRIQQAPATEGGDYGPSDGRFQMGFDADSVLVQGDFVMQSHHRHSNLLTSGVLEVQGNFSQLLTHRIYSHSNFATSNKHKVVLSGQGQQVTFETDGSRFTNLEFAPGSASSISFLTPITVYGTLITHGQSLPSINGALTWTLEQDERIDGELILSGGNLNLAGHSLTVSGNLIQEAGFVSLNSGHLTVEGDYRVQKAPETHGGQYGPSTGRLDMRSAAAHVLVRGNFVMQSNRSHSNLLYEGVLEVKGNFTTLPTTMMDGFSNFEAAGGHKLLLSGQQQQLSLLAEYSRLNILELAPGSAPDISFMTPINVYANIITHGQSLPSITGALTWVLEHDQRIEGELILSGGNLSLAGRSLTVTGNLIQEGGTVSLNHGHLTVTGNLIQEGGTVSLNHGHLTVNGDYRMQSKPAMEGGAYQSGNGRLLMRHAADYVSVQGDFVTQSAASHIGSLLAGIMEVKGNFAQLLTIENTGVQNFTAYGEHKVLLSGRNQQISFESDGSYFHTLEFAPGSASGVQFLTPLYVRNNLITHGQALPSFAGHVNWVLSQDQLIEGDLRLTGGQLNLGGRSLKVAGNLTQQAGTIFINNGSLLVYGDYRVQSPPVVEDGIYLPSDGRLQMTEAADYVLVMGDFVMQSHQSHLYLLRAGLMEIKGSFAQLRTSASNSRYNFHASNGHRVLLSGQLEQRVEFEAPESGFATLQNANPVAIVFSGDVRITNPQQYLLRLAVTTNIESRVVSMDAKLDCGERCETFYQHGDVVVLQVRPRRGEVLADWPVDCFVDRDSCTFSVDQVRHFSFEFVEAESAPRRRSSILKLLMLSGSESAN